MKRIVILSIILVLSGCQTINRVKVRKQLLKEHVITGQIIPGANSFNAVCKLADVKHKPGIYNIKSQKDYDFYYKLQKNVKSSPNAINFANRYCILAVTGASEYTNIEFHELIDGTDGVYHAYFVVNRKPVENADETRAFCFVDLPKVYGELKVEFIYLRENLYTGYVIETADAKKTFTIQK